jgi:hypothetical protein
MGFNFDRSRKTVDRQIARNGGGKGKGFLERNSVRRAVTCAIVEYKPTERALVLDGSRRALVSALDPVTGAVLTTPPDHELDQFLIFAGQKFRFMAADRGPRPDGNAVFHDLEVQYDSRDV